MRILLLTTNYPPERQPWGIKFAELAQLWRQQGHEVTVLTGYPFWPEGRVHEPYRRRLGGMTEEMDGVRVVRVWHHTSPVNSFFHRVATFLTMTAGMRRWGRRNADFDLVYAAVPPPTMATTAIRIAERSGCPSVVDIEDIHPDAAIESGFIKNPLLISILRRQERWIYRNATLLCPLGETFMRRMAAKGVLREKLHRIWNWIDTEFVRPGARMNRIRERWDIGEKEFVVLYAGTMGRQHGTRLLVEAAKEMREEAGVRFVLVGLGVEREPNERLAEQWGLSNIEFHDFVPREDLPEMQAVSDVSLVTLRAGRGNSSNPSKLLGYLAAGRPVIASVQPDCDTAAIVEEAGCGVITEPGDVGQLVDAIRRLRASKYERERMGASGRRWVETHASMKATDEMAAEIPRRALDLF